jgi:hypothetical protein
MTRKGILHGDADIPKISVNLITVFLFIEFLSYVTLGSASFSDQQVFTTFVRTEHILYYSA